LARYITLSLRIVGFLKMAFYITASLSTVKHGTVSKRVERQILYFSATLQVIDPMGK